MRSIVSSTRFGRSVRRAAKRGKSLDKLEEAVALLASDKPLPARLRDHKLTGEYRHCRECHLEPDWLLIYQLVDETLVLVDTGSHAELFR